MSEQHLLRERVNELFHVDVGSGVFIRKTNRGGRRAGEIAGTVRPDGYRQISIDNRHYLEHQLVFFMSYGHFPDQVDHINGVKVDNRVSNLRAVSSSLNSRNQRLSRANKTGAAGVRYRSERDAYEAYWDEESGKRRSKYFKCAKYGSMEFAFKEALDFRSRMIALMNSNGAGYTERHGREVCA
ncbi:HNH endonuclease [Pseudomonas aeruginosa]|uniref:HNH endonuclease n=1 Tax=Pseudomonas aeruginosa TaxID=287 RepID=UPI000D686072|nr:HNH endonuclease [Pseudomonas aeruginosa]